MLTSWLVAASCALAIGFLLDWMGHAMSWYTNIWLVCGLFMAPAAAAIIAVCSAAKRLFYQVSIVLFSLSDFISVIQFLPSLIVLSYFPFVLFPS